MSSDDQVLKWLEEVNSGKHKIRAPALEEMRALGVEKIIPLLVARLEDPDEEIRVQALATEYHERWSSGRN